MQRNLLSVLALLLGTAFLLAGNGLHGLLLPMRGSVEGFSSASLGLLGTAWATGFVLGCLFSPRIVRRIGHVRAFSAFSAMIAIIALLTGLLIDPWSWIILRVITGFALAGAFMIIESWLNERATNETRGMIFSLYMTITYAAIVIGQMAISLGDVRSQTFFIICGILYCFALLPTALSTASSPAPLKQAKLDLRIIYRNSPVSFVAIILVGIANGAFGTLAPVFGGKSGLAEVTIAAMMSVTIFSGALMQVPAGRMSDRTDRRYVLAALSAIAAASGAVIAFIQPEGIGLLFGLVALYGGMAYTLYSIVVAHANDFAESDQFMQISSGLLLLYGIGTIIGPTIGGVVMELGGPHALFMVTAAAHGGVAVYALIRSRLRPPVPAAEKESFSATPSSRAATPQTIALDPRATANDN